MRRTTLHCNNASHWLGTNLDRSCLLCWLCNVYHEYFGENWPCFDGARLSEKIFFSPITTWRSFGSPGHFGVFVLRIAYRSWFAGFWGKKWPVFQVKFWPWIKICDIASINMNANKKNVFFFSFNISFSERRLRCSQLSDTMDGAALYIDTAVSSVCRLCDSYWWNW